MASHLHWLENKLTESLKDVTTFGSNVKRKAALLAKMMNAILLVIHMSTTSRHQISSHIFFQGFLVSAGYTISK
jgi:hypothetical protein